MRRAKNYLLIFICISVFVSSNHRTDHTNHKNPEHNENKNSASIHYQCLLLINEIFIGL